MRYYETHFSKNANFKKENKEEREIFEKIEELYQKSKDKENEPCQKE